MTSNQPHEPIVHQVWLVRESISTLTPPSTHESVHSSGDCDMAKLEPSVRVETV
jgi:hypothetical protein